MITAPAPSRIKQILTEHNRGINLDIGCGPSKMDGFVGMDIKAQPGVDIVWDIERFPYPLPDESASVIMASHILEHINPTRGDPRMVPLINLLIENKTLTKEQVKKHVGEYDFPSTIFMRFMDECWRILKPEGQFMMVFPYGGSLGYWQDPTHVNGLNEVTFAYFDPMEPNSRGGLYSTYMPKPWKIEYSTWAQNGNMEVCLNKRREDKQYYGK